MESSPLPPEFTEDAIAAAKADCFGPPAEPCLCFCLHCQRQFMSDQMWFQPMLRKNHQVDGFWMCPTSNCGGAGFKFDIFPVDPDHPANAGWHSWDDDGVDEGEEAEWEEGEEQSPDAVDSYDPAEPAYAEMDEEEEFDPDIEGEEWKLGLQPGEEPPETSAMIDARQRWEAEQKQYDLPDERPRWIDRSDEPDPPEMTEDDIPF